MNSGISKIESGCYINESTGERFNETFKKSNVKIDELMVEFKPNSKFTKIFMMVKPNFSKIVYDGYFMRLIRLLEAHTNILILKKRDRYVIGTADRLAEVIGVSSNSFRKFLTEAKILGVILGASTTSGYGYVVNPAYACNGRSIGTFLYRIFEKDENFIDSLTLNQIKSYNVITKHNYMKNIKHNFPEIYKRLTDGSVER